MPVEKFLQVVLMDQSLTGVESGDLGQIVVHTDNIMPQLGKTRSSY
jgi:hypothetical protein